MREQPVHVDAAETEQGPGFVGTVAYRDLEFAQVEVGPGAGEVSREKLVDDVMVGVHAEAGQKQTRNGLRLTGSRKLCLRATEGASVAVNGRAGRRTVCVLDGKGVEVEVVDMAEEEGVEEEMGE